MIEPISMTDDGHPPNSRLRVAAYTGSSTVSSRRFRVLQYIERLAKLAVDIDEYVSRWGSWPPISYTKRPFWLAATVLDRIVPIARSFAYDVTLLQRELVSTLATLERFSHRPRVLDIDDAVWLTSKRACKTFTTLANLSDGIICGNNFIAENVPLSSTKKIIILPTPVDTARFIPAQRKDTNKQIIGWSGLSSGFQYLLGIEKALLQVISGRSNVVFRVVSDKKPTFQWLSESMVEYVKWTPTNEVQTIQEMTVGLMPIDDTLWSRGKCSYKMLLYMSCAIPVVVSPYGMNADVLKYGNVGFGAATPTEWVEHIKWLLDHPEAAHQIGLNGRQIVEQHYSLDVVAPQMASYLKSFRTNS